MSYLEILPLACIALGVFGCQRETTPSAAVPDMAEPAPTSLAPMPVPRAGSAVAVGADHAIYLIGGWNSRLSLSRVDVYHPESDTWTSAPPLQVGRHVAQAVTLADGRLVVFGGIGGDRRDRISSAEVYTPGDSGWKPFAELSEKRCEHAAALDAKGRIFAIGGDADDGTPSSAVNGNIASSVDVYDPAADKWSLGTPLSIGRWGARATTGSDGKIYVVGGATTTSWLATSEVYDAAADRWDAGPALGDNRILPASTVGADGRFYLIGGDHVLPGVREGVVIDGTFALSFTDQKWTTPAALPTGRDNAAAAATPDGYIYVFGGIDAKDQYLAQVQRYSIALDEWLQNPSE